MLLDSSSRLAITATLNVVLKQHIAVDLAPHATARDNISVALYGLVWPAAG